jgi:hypothetical protein
LSQGLDKTTPAEYLAASQMLKDAGFNATVKDISAITGAGPEVLGGELQAQVDAYMDPRVVKESEAIQAFKDLGYTDPTPEEISAFIGQRDQASTLSDLSKQYDPLATTVDEARQMMRDLGYTNFTDAEAMSLAGKIKEAEAQKNVEEYVNPRQFTRAEAEQYFRDLGYTPTEQELTQFIRSGPEVMESAVKSELGTYVDPLVVDEQEVRDVLASLGFPDATDAQIKSLTGQYAEAKLAGLAEENLPQFMYNALKEQNNQLRQQIGTQARAANQADIDALSQMIAGQQAVDLTYDVTGDKQITQADLDYLRSVVTGSSPDWVAPAGTVWGGTGLQGQLAQAEAQRQRDAAAQQAAAKEAERRSAIRSAAGQAGAQVQQIIGQLPEAMKGLQTTTTPIYGGEINPFDLSAPLDVNFFSPSKEKQGSQTGQQTTKIATGGYLDDLLDLLR